MTEGQRITLMAKLWPAACKTQGWNKSDRAKRMEVLAQILNRPLESANDIDSREDFTRVKRGLEVLADNVAAAMDDGTENTARQIRHVIRTQLMPCIALYVPDADAYVREIIKDKFNRGRRVDYKDLDDLTARPRFIGDKETDSQLATLVYTLTARLNGKTGLRNTAGDDLHTMRIKAGVGCSCRRCCKLAAQGFRLDKTFTAVPIGNQVERPETIIFETLPDDTGEPVLAGTADDNNQPF